MPACAEVRLQQCGSLTLARHITLLARAGLCVPAARIEDCRDLCNRVSNIFAVFRATYGQAAIMRREQGGRHRWRRRGLRWASRWGVCLVRAASWECLEHLHPFRRSCPVTCAALVELAVPSAVKATSSDQKSAIAIARTAKTFAGIICRCSRRHLRWCGGGFMRWD